MMTRTSPGPTAPSTRSVASTSSIISSVVWTLRMSREDTPHDRASRRRTSTNGVSAMIGTSGRAWEMRRAEAPDSVNATIARAPSACPAAEAAVEIASENPTPTRSGRRRRVSSTRTARSARSAIRAITSTASAGYRPVGAELAQEVQHLRDVGHRLHERDGDEVDAVLEAEAEVLAVLVGEARDRERHARERDPLVVADAPAHDDPTAHLLWRGLFHQELDHSVVHPDRVARVHVREVLGVIQRRALRRAHHGLRAERERLAGLQE